MKTRLQAWGDSKVIPIASVVVVDPEGRLLLLQRHSDDLGGKMWGIPAGRLETGEEPLIAALRELYEETGIEAATAELLGRHEIRMPHGTVHMTSFRLVLPEEPVIILDFEEHHNFQWLHPEMLFKEKNLLWGVPTTLHDFGFITLTGADPTLADGSQVILLS